MDLFREIFLEYTTELLIAVLLFTVCLKKRSHFWLRVILGIVIADVIAYFFGMIGERTGGVLQMLEGLCIFLFLAIPFVIWCCEGKPEEYLLCVLCGVATEHFTASLHVLFLIGSGRVWSTYDFIPVFICSYGAFYFLFADRMKRNGGFTIYSKYSLVQALTIVPVVYILSSAAKVRVLVDGENFFFLLTQVYAMICCIFILWMQLSIQREIKLQREWDLKESVWLQKKEQYQLSKEKMDIINRRCHDLKHQISALRQMDAGTERNSYLDELETSAAFFDMSFDTGNEALDTVLAEKSLTCSRYGISLLCVADGCALSFMNVIDLYTLFGNALDNAIEAVVKIEDAAKKDISLKVYTSSGMLIIQTENFFHSAPVMENGEWKTNKEDAAYHGLGIKSMTELAEKYGGYLKTRILRDMFYLVIVIPIPRDAI